MSGMDQEKESASRISRFIKAELKRAGIGYKELAQRLNEEHGLRETEDSITSKLGRGTFAATFFIAAMKAIGAEQVRLEDV